MKTVILILALVCVIYASGGPIGGQTDSNGCAAAEGYTWCQKMNSCIRPWEVAKANNISNDVKTISKFCSTECLASAGYTWCNYEGKCIRPWELAKEKGLENTPENVESYCNLKKGSSTPSTNAINTDTTDAHGCIISAGYTWCQRENACVRPWELAKAKGFDTSLKSFRNYCIIQNDIHQFVESTKSFASRADIGGAKDEHGCLIGAGFTWCSKESKCVQFWQIAAEKGLKNVEEATSYCADCLASAGYSFCNYEGKCVRTWELASQKNFPNTEEAITQYCSQPRLPTINTTPQTPIGGASNAHGCIAGAGYTWCEAENKCVRPWELASQKNFVNSADAFQQYCAGTPKTSIGGTSDAHGCVSGAGYTWCQTENKCVRPWELAREQNFAISKDAFVQYCTGTTGTTDNNQPIGGSSDAHGCIAGAGYTWCPAEGKCVRPWELAREKGMTMEAVRDYCS